MKKRLFSLFSLILAVAMLLPAMPVLTVSAAEDLSKKDALVGASLYLDDQVDVVFHFDADVIEAKKAKGTEFTFTLSFGNKTYTEKDLVDMKDDASGKVYRTITVGPFKASERNTVYTFWGSMNHGNTFSPVSLAKSGISYYKSLPVTDGNLRVINALKSFVNYAVAVDNLVKNIPTTSLPYPEVTFTKDTTFTADDGSGTGTLLEPNTTLSGRKFIFSDEVYLRYSGTTQRPAWGTRPNLKNCTVTINSVDVTDSCNLTVSGNNFEFTVPVHADQGSDKLRIVMRNGDGKVIVDCIDRADQAALLLDGLKDDNGYDYTMIGKALCGYMQAVSEYSNNPVVTKKTFEEGKFYAGFGRVDITPYCDSTELNTSGTLSTEFVDPIYASCVAMRDENGEITLTFSIDIRNIQSGRNDHYETMKNAVMQETAKSGYNISADHIFFNATHNHSAPSVSSSNATVTTWLNTYLFPRLPLAAKMALQDMAPVEKAYTGTAITGEGTNYNRRYTRDVGSTTIRDYEDNQNGDQNRDRELRTIRFEREGAKDILLVNWQAHAANAAHWADKGSSDFVGALRSTVEKDLDVHFLYVNGASGDLNMTNHSSLDTNESNFRNSDGIDYVGVGNSIANTVKALVGSNNEKETALGDMKVTTVNTGTLNLQYRKHVSDGKYCVDGNCAECAGKYWAITYNEKLSTKGATAYNKNGEYTDTETGIIYQYRGNSKGTFTKDQEVVEGGKTYRRYVAYHTSQQYAAAKDEVSIYSFQYQATKFNMYTVTIGDKIGFAYCPYEMFNRNGRNIRNDVKEVVGSDATIFIGGYTNGYLSYMATSAAFTKVAEGRGGADVDDGTGETFTTKYAKGTAEVLEAKLTAALKASFGY